ncbi:MAG: hypothetical protein EP332_02220 [Bacteroidetes bacterium]|nr:MAG: hypothetical protein EP332_02220 [Bacteroidota bacterium]
MLLFFGLLPLAFADVQREHKLTGIVVTHLDTLGQVSYHKINELQREEWKDSIAQVEYCQLGEPIDVKGFIMIIPSKGDITNIPFANSTELTQEIRRFGTGAMPAYRGRIRLLELKDSTDKEYPEVKIDLLQK